MAEYVSHLLMADETLNSLDGEIKKFIERNIHAFNLGAQGPDFFFHIKAKTTPNLVDIGDKLHNEDINKKLKLMLNFSKTQSSYEKETCLSYIYGYVLHYNFDKLFHPYIGKVTGAVFNLPHKKYLKNNKIQHLKLEAEIASQLYYYFKGEQIYKHYNSFYNYCSMSGSGIIATMWVNVLKELYGIETRFYDMYTTLKTMLKERRLLLNKPLMTLVKPIWHLFGKRFYVALTYPKVKTEPYKDVLNIFNKAKNEGIRDISLVYLEKNINGELKMSNGLCLN